MKPVYLVLAAGFALLAGLYVVSVAGALAGLWSASARVLLGNSACAAVFTAAAVFFAARWQSLKRRAMRRGFAVHPAERHE